MNPCPEANRRNSPLARIAIGRIDFRRVEWTLADTI